MSITNETETTKNEEIHHTPQPKPERRRKRYFASLALGAVAVLAVGAAGGAAAMKLTRGPVEFAPLNPAPISAMAEDSLVTVKGKVAEIFGNKFIVQDESGRALVETGPEGRWGEVVRPNELVTVQGHFDDGFVHGRYIVREDGNTLELGPAGKPPRGPDRDRGPGHDPRDRPMP